MSTLNKLLVSRSSLALDYQRAHLTNCWQVDLALYWIINVLLTNCWSVDLALDYQRTLLTNCWSVDLALHWIISVHS